jgi:hypothetical protein
MECIWRSRLVYNYTDRNNRGTKYSMMRYITDLAPMECYLLLIGLAL